jgi:hypothetical protein
MNKNTLGAVLIIAGLLIGLVGGYQFGKMSVEKERYKDLDIMDSLKREISDRREIIKYDTIMVQGERSIDTIKIYYKIKQNAQKMDTTTAAVVSRFYELLTANRNRENKGGK